MKTTTTIWSRALSWYAGLVLALVIGIAQLPAATFTPYNPTPNAGEVDLDDIIAAQGPGWERVPDNLDMSFPIPGYGSLFLVAWEDLPFKISDNDFNDVVLKYDSLANTFQFIAGYSGDTHTWYESGGVLYLDSGQTCCGTGDFTSLSQPDRMLTWGKPLEAVPEPSSVALMGMGLLGLVWWGKRR